LGVSRDTAEVSTGGGLVQISHQICLGIGTVVKTFATAEVSLAGQQKVFQALRPTEGIEGLQKVQQGSGPELLRAMHVPVITSHQPPQLSETVGSPQPIA